jgi:serine/threonine protein kinase
METVVKSFKVPNIIRRIVYTFFRDSKAKKSYEYSLKIGNFTPEPIGYIEFYKNSLLERSYFVAKKFEYDFTIREPLLDDSFSDKTKILQKFAIFTCNLHDSDILHKDYSPGNILIKKENGSFIFKIVDINRMEFKKLSLEERMKNFAKLWISDKDLKIVIEAYSKYKNLDFEKCYNLALEASHKLKNKVNMKKRIKGIEVVD